MEATLERSDEMIRIERFAGDDLHLATDAFAALAPKIRIVVVRLLASSLPRSDDREDVASTVLQRLWQNRTRFEARSVGAWWRYVGVTARRCAQDHHSIEVPSEIEDGVADRSPSDLEFDVSRFYEAADELWLQVDPALNSRERNRRLLAAQLHVLHDRPREEAAAIVRASPSALDEWLRCESVSLRLSYMHLYVGNELLTCHLLSVKDGSSGLDRLTAQAREGIGEPPPGWTWEEVQIVVLRIRNGLSETKIAQMLGREVQEVERILRVCSERSPFLERARELKKKLRRRGIGARALASTDLWRRIVFQYHAFDSLPQRQILERTSGQAEVLGYALNAGILNAWLSNRRILVQLVDYLRREGRVD